MPLSVASCHTNPQHALLHDLMNFLSFTPVCHLHIWHPLSSMSSLKGAAERWRYFIGFVRCFELQPIGVAIHLIHRCVSDGVMVTDVDMPSLFLSSSSLSDALCHGNETPTSSGHGYPRLPLVHLFLINTHLQYLTTVIPTLPDC